MNRYVLTAITLLISVIGYSQNVIVMGNAQMQPDKLVRIITYSDGFSNLENTVTQTRTDGEGDFTFQLEVGETQFAFLAMGLEKGEFYLSPGSSYSFTIPMDTSFSKGSIFDRIPLQFLVNPDDGGVQHLIEDFNIDFNNFIYNNVNAIYRSRDKSIVNQYVAGVNTRFANCESEFVHNYVKYSVASLLWLSRKENNHKILENYIINQPVLYNNIQYTDFFKDFFKSYFDSEKIFRYEDLVFAINNQESVKEVDQLLSRDEQLLSDNRVREIVTMLLLSKYYHDRNVVKEYVILKFEEIAKESSFPENQQVANNFIVKLKKMQSGVAAPDFKLAGSNDSILSLTDFKDKFVLMSFIATDCRICESHMAIITDIRDRNDGKFEIITIAIGPEFDKLTSFAKQRGYDWTILNLDEEILLLEDYNIKAYPSYIFINPDGTIANAQLPMPDENMEVYIQRNMDKYNNSQ